MELTEVNAVDENIDDIEEELESFSESQSLSYFGTDFDVHGLVRRMNQADIVVPSFDPVVQSGLDLEGFQRRFVWSKSQMDRFIESLLLGYPIPGIFLVQQSDKKLLVLDGQQRLRTLQAFFKGLVDKKEFVLEYVGDQFKDAKYESLDIESRRTLDNTFIHATIVKYNPAINGDEAVYQVFERLNTGGTNLVPHEIRVALYNGKLARVIQNLNMHPSWRTLYGEKFSDRLKDQELILRFIAFHQASQVYERPLKKFLNDFMKNHRNMKDLNEGELRKTFYDASDAIASHIGNRAFRIGKQVNAALVDSLLQGVSTRQAKGKITDWNSFKIAYESLMKNPEFLSAITRATADEERVRARLKAAIDAFENVL
jgi:Protein of unknown function DUF262